MWKKREQQESQRKNFDGKAAPKKSTENVRNSDLERRTFGFVQESYGGYTHRTGFEIFLKKR